MLKTVKTTSILAALLLATSTSLATAQCGVRLVRADGFMVNSTKEVPAYCQCSPTDDHPHEWYGCLDIHGNVARAYVDLDGLSALTQGVQELSAMAASPQGQAAGWHVICSSGCNQPQ